MSVQALDNTMTVFKKLQHLYITPYIDEQTVGFVKYDIRAIVADSVEIAQDDNTVNSKKHEFTDQVLFEHINLGQFQFKATCIDFQNTILKELMGFTQVGNTLLAPNGYVDKWVCVELAFAGQTPNVVIPKLKLNSKIIFSELRSGCAEHEFGGTAYEQSFSVWTNGVETIGTAPLFFFPKSADLYEIRSDYGYLTWANDARVLWDNGDSIIN